jgi:hypothetical protein
MNPGSVVLSGTETPSPINELPSELLVEIATSLPFRDVLRLCQTSSYFRSLFCSRDQTIWRRLYRRDLSTLRSPKNHHYRQAYLTYFRQIRGKSLIRQLLISDGRSLRPNG